MVKYEKIKKIISESNGILTTSEMIKKGISYYYINMLIKDNIIIRNEKGVYVRNDIIEDDFYIFQQKNKKVVFSYNTTLYFYNETERTPEYMDITVYKGYNVHRISERVKIHYINRENLYLGATKVKTPQGFEVIAYDLERTLCDIIKNRDTGIDKEQTNKFIRNMFLHKKIDYKTLMNYARKLKCEKKIKEIMEVLI